jgi:hypothetical protein
LILFNLNKANSSKNNVSNNIISLAASNCYLIKSQFIYFGQGWQLTLKKQTRQTASENNV